MEASTGSSNDRTGAPGQTQSIICGAFLTVAAAVAGISYYPIFGALGFTLTGVLLISTILLFRLERPATFLGPQDGDHDIRNLYGQSGTDREKHSGERPDDNKVA